MSAPKGVYVFVLALLLPVGRLLASTHFRYMTSHCSGSLEVNTSLALALTPDTNLGHGRDRDFVHCAVDIRTHPGKNIMAHFLQMSISPDTEHSDRLELYELTPRGKIRLTPARGLYGKLERSLMLFDSSGRDVDDYVTTGDRLRLDYLGKPSIHHPGFRVLLTAVTNSEGGSSCPSQWLWCTHMHLCVPPTAWCDGWHNCGKNDLTDEKGCASAEKVTDLLDDYSLGDDIVLRVFVPLAVFLLVVAMALCLARRYIRYKYSPVPQTPAVMYNSEKGVQIIQPESRPISPAIYDPPSYDVVVDPPPAYSSLLSLAESGEIVMESGEESGDSTGRMRRKEAQRKRESYSGRAYAEAGSPKPLSQLERYRQKKYCPSDSESEDEEARQRRRKKGGKSKSRVTKQGSSSQSSEQTSPSIELQPLSRDRHTPCSSSSIHGMSPLAAPSHHRVHNGEGGCSDAGRTAVVDKDSSLTDRTRNNAAVLSTTASSTSRGANSDDKHSPEHTQEFIPIHKEASNQHRQHAHVPNSYRSCGDRHVDVNATTSTDNSTSFMNDSEESKKEPKGRAVKNGHVNRGGAVQCHTAEINISNPTAHLPVEHTVNGDSNSLKEKEDKETCRLGGSSSGDHLVEAKIKEESRVTGNGVSHTSVEAV